MTEIVHGVELAYPVVLMAILTIEIRGPSFRLAPPLRRRRLPSAANTAADYPQRPTLMPVIGCEVVASSSICQQGCCALIRVPPNHARRCD